MDPTNSNQTKNNSALPVIVAGASLVAALIGYIVGQMTLPGRTVSEKDSTGVAACGDDAYAAGYEAARQKLIEQGILGERPQISDEMLAAMTQFTGVFGALSGDTLTVRIPAIDPLADETVRNVTLTAETKIVRLEMKDQNTLSKEMTAYRKEMESFAPEGDDAANFPTPPSQYNEVPADRSVLIDGASLDVTTAETLSSQSLTATYIRVTPAQPAPQKVEVPIPSMSEGE